MITAGGFSGAMRKSTLIPTAPVSRQSARQRRCSVLRCPNDSPPPWKST